MKLKMQRAHCPYIANQIPSVYISGCCRNGNLYTGITRNLKHRMKEHKDSGPEAHVIHRVQRLLWYEEHDLMEAAIFRHNQIRKWKRNRKLCLILRDNPYWLDLYDDLNKQ